MALKVFKTQRKTIYEDEADTVDNIQSIKTDTIRRYKYNTSIGIRTETETETKNRKNGDNIIWLHPQKLIM